MHSDIDAAPISIFPPEILQTIFSFDQDVYPYALQPKSGYPQLRLTHVCRTWRYAALGLPLLWNRIHVWLEPYGSMASANGHTTWSWQDSLDMFLSFAQNFPLMVDIVWFPQTEVHEVHRISAALFQTSPRWKVASLSFQTEIDWSFLDPLHAKLPLLEDLTFDVREGASPGPIVMKHCNAFSIVPSLRTVRLLSTFSGLPTLEIPWHQITRLSTRLPKHAAAEISRFIYHGVSTIGSSGGLKELSIRDPFNSRTSLPASIVIPSLTRLSFQGGRDLVGSLILPALRELTIWDYPTRGSNKGFLVVDAARELICRSKCTITVLKVDGYIPLTAQPLADVAVHFHALTHLAIHTSGIRGPGQSEDMFASLLAILTPSSSSTAAGKRHVFPVLERLTLTREHTSASANDFPLSRGTVDAFCKMLELRYPSHSAPPRIFTQATFLPVTRLLPKPVADFQRLAWLQITRFYQGQLDILVQVPMGTYSYILSVEHLTSKAQVTTHGSSRISRCGWGERTVGEHMSDEVAALDEVE